MMQNASQSQATVLLVDDRPDKLLALETMLEPLHYNIVKAESGKDALRLLLKQAFHLVILDVNMPGLNGFETARLIRERDVHSELPIIFVSAYDASDEETERGYQLGAVDFIHTPIHPAVLRARVSTFVVLRIRTDELQKANAHLRDVNDQMSAFLYTVSHDLRAPLRSINGFTKILLEEAPGIEGEYLGYLRRIGMSGLKMSRLLDDLLEYCRLAQSAMPTETVELESIIHEVLLDLQTDIDERKATVTLSGTYPQVTGNRVLIGQVLCNLLRNALKFVSADVCPAVRISWQESGSAVRLIVEDNGIGIAPEHQQRIFGVFERLHAEDTFSGTGIGLAIVRRAVERMGGTTGVESQLGQGSRFWFELPKATAE